MTPTEVLHVLEQHGVSVQDEGGELTVVGRPSAFTPRIHALIDENRSALRAHLRSAERIANTETAAISPDLQVAKEIPADFRRRCELLVVGGMDDNVDRGKSTSAAADASDERATLSLLNDYTNGRGDDVGFSVSCWNGGRPLPAPMKLAITLELQDGAWRVSLSGPMVAVAPRDGAE